VLGGIFTSTNRFIKTPALNFMNRNAYTGGIDLFHQWHDKEYYIEAKLVGSNIRGNAEAMTGLQQSSARYYQRPDAHHLHYDSTAGMLSGSGGSIKIGKGSVKGFCDIQLNVPGVLPALISTIWGICKWPMSLNKKTPFTIL
jgi:hypothetical protein